MSTSFLFGLLVSLTWLASLMRYDLGKVHYLRDDNNHEPNLWTAHDDAEGQVGNPTCDGQQKLVVDPACPGCMCIRYRGCPNPWGYMMRLDCSSIGCSIGCCSSTSSSIGCSIGCCSSIGGGSTIGCGSWISILHGWSNQ